MEFLVALVTAFLLVVPVELARDIRHPALFDVAGCRAFQLDGRRAVEPARAA